MHSSPLVTCNAMSRETLVGSSNLPYRVEARGPSTGRTRHRCLPLGPSCQKCSRGTALHSPSASTKSRHSWLTNRSSEDFSQNSSVMIIFNATYFCVSWTRQSQIDRLCRICPQYARDETPQVDIPRDPLRQGANLARTTALLNHCQRRDRTHTSGISQMIRALHKRMRQTEKDDTASNIGSAVPWIDGIDSE
jgi:hypothetical protein